VSPSVGQVGPCAEQETGGKWWMRLFLTPALVVIALSGCSSAEFATDNGNLASGDGGPGGDGGNGNGGAGTGGSIGKGGSSTGGKGNGGGVSAGGASAGGAGNGGAISDGGASAGGAGNGGASAGGGMSSGGAGAGGMSAGGASAGGGIGAGGVSAGGGISAGGGTGVTQSGDCTLGGTDCHNSTRCVEVTAGGYRVCAVKFPEASTCAGPGECCKTSDCQSGQICYPEPLAPACGGPVVIDGNVCSGDLCTSDAACGANEICAPAGTFERKVRMCVPAGCRLDTDCKASPGGICAPVSGGCCNAPFGLYCVYPGVGCRSNADCASGNCQIDANAGYTICSNGPIICPV
jgi:hypothetical protein